MAETLGTLVDKLSIVKLKEFHTEDAERLASLAAQESQLKSEIDEFVAAAIDGRIPIDRLTFASNKVYKREGNETREITGTIAEVIASLLDVNAKVWRVQESVYDFESVPPDEKNGVIRQLAILNLERNHAIDALDKTFAAMIKTGN